MTGSKDVSSRNPATHKLLLHSQVSKGPSSCPGPKGSGCLLQHRPSCCCSDARTHPTLTSQSHRASGTHPEGHRSAPDSFRKLVFQRGKKNEKKNLFPGLQAAYLQCQFTRNCALSWKKKSILEEVGPGGEGGRKEAVTDTRLVSRLPLSSLSQGGRKAF